MSPTEEFDSGIKKIVLSMKPEELVVVVPQPAPWYMRWQTPVVVIPSYLFGGPILLTKVSFPPFVGDLWVFGVFLCIVFCVLCFFSFCLNIGGPGSLFISPNWEVKAEKIHGGTNVMFGGRIRKKGESSVWVSTSPSTLLQEKGDVSPETFAKAFLKLLNQRGPLRFEEANSLIAVELDKNKLQNYTEAS